ncbi:MAG: pyridoxamine 5'-phosphate oxidase family protein [Nitriliruptorales bacterium]|nr:pyridoxamine 5'-phosphate oxidase family protein [Nitriliruptorales bacterium]
MTTTIQAMARLTELSLPECLELIGTRGVGRLAFDDEHGPIIVPVNYTFHGGVVHMRTADGSKLEAAQRRAMAAFEVDVVDVDHGDGWSVVIRGRLRRLVAPESTDYPGEPEPLADGDRHHLIGLVPQSITGRGLTPTGNVHIPAEPEGNIWWGRDGDDLLG